MATPVTSASELTQSQTLAVAATTWRLINGFDIDGVRNMAIDEALLESVIAGGPPVVRFYTWSNPTLSIGVNQRIGQIDLAACDQRGIGVVRRMTGGRAVLHHHELTYSIIARENDQRVSGGVLESYRKISMTLVYGLQMLGVDVELSPYNRRLFSALETERHELDAAGDSGQEHGAVCFDAASAYELTANGKKLMGSAQARRGGALLQHGSILLDINWEAWGSVFLYASEAGRERAMQKLPARMTSLKQELGGDISPQDVAGALRAAFERVFLVVLEAGGLSAEEDATVEKLAAEKYGTSGWTMRK